MFEKKTFAWAIMTIGLLVFSSTIPAYANVSLVQTDTSFYIKGNSATISGEVEADVTDLITIVVRDQNGKFVLLTQAFPQPDNTFSKTIDVNTKFTYEGTYNATAFVNSMVNGSSVTFDVYNPGSSSIPVITSTPQSTTNQPVEETIEDEIISNTNETISSVEETTDTTTETTTTKSTTFPDPDKDPQEYVDRYLNEPKYKDWFDRNYPEQTIYEVVGIDDPTLEVNVEDITDEELDNILENADDEIISQSTVIPSSNSELTQMAFAIGGLGVLFGAVYGVKKRTDNNAQKISKNKIEIEQTKMAKTACDEPMEVLKTRLAKGEITVEEFNELKKIVKRK